MIGRWVTTSEENEVEGSASCIKKPVEDQTAVYKNMHNSEFDSLIDSYKLRSLMILYTPQKDPMYVDSDHV